jgi:O-Antigen ligase
VLGGPARPKLVALGSVAPGGAIAGALAYGASEIASKTPASAAAADEGHRIAVWLVGCAISAGLLQLASRRLDTPRRERVRRQRPRWAVPALIGACAVLLAGALAAGLADRVSTQYHRFVDENEVNPSDTHSRLTSVGNNGRLDHWRVALHGADESLLHGSGAGTFVLLWQRDAETPYTVTEAHSLYVEVLGELGVVGLALVAGAIVFMLGSLALRARRTRDPALAVAAAAGLAWAVHAGVDWDWEMPAVTLWWFAIAGLGIAGSPLARDRRGQNLARVGVAAVVLLLALTPVAMLLSQRQLNRASDAFDRGDCGAAIDAALSASDTAPMRPEGYELLALCDVRLGQPRLAVQAMRKAIDRDPENWRMHYEMALARGAARLDPRRAAQRALGLNPQEPLAQRAVRRFDTDRASKWRRRALSARLP